MIENVKISPLLCATFAFHNSIFSTPKEDFTRGKSNVPPGRA